MAIHLPAFPKKLIFPFIVVLVLAGSIGASYYFFRQYQKSQAMLKDPTAAQQAEVKDTTGKVSKLMELPQDEEPSVATVLDKSKLADQAFFAKAENNDKVLIYSKTGMAILYRPSTNKIINVSPINLGAGAATGTDAATGVKVAVYNGAGVAGLSTTFADNIVKLVNNLTITQKVNAAKADYARSIVVDLTGTKAEMAKQLATLIDGDVGALPAGEAKPTDATTEFLVILGKNYTSPAAPPAPAASPAATPAQ